MTITFFTVILPLLAALTGSLYLTRFAADLQEQMVIKLQRLTTLDRRRASTRATIKALETLDDNPDLIKVLYQSLKADLQRLKQLDPNRAGLDAEINHASSRQSGSGASGAGQNREKLTSLATTREVAAAGRHINDALAILRRLQRFRKISHTQYDAAQQRLRYLSAMISVNSSIRMAQIALERHDRIEALACYRRAESFLQLGAITGSERINKQVFINAEKEKMLAENASEKGLLLLATDR